MHIYLQNYEDLDGKMLGIALWQKDEKGENDVIMLSGKCRLIKEVIYLESAALANPLVVLNEWKERIRVLNDANIKKIFHDADYGLSLIVGDLPKDADQDEFNAWGLRI